MKAFVVFVFMLDTDAQLNLVKARCVHPDMPILRENKLYIEDIMNGYIESLGSIQLLFKDHPITKDVVPDDFRIPQEEIFGTDILKESRPTDIRNDVQGFVK
jgi:hypothetical protein